MVVLAVTGAAIAAAVTVHGVARGEGTLKNKKAPAGVFKVRGLASLS